MQINVRQVILAGILGTIAIMLEMSKIGYIPISAINSNATIMHVPIIIGAILYGPIVGTLTGLIFGIFNMLYDTTGLFTHPIVSILPRILIGITASYSHNAIVQRNVDLATATAAIIGTLTNTICIVGLWVLFSIISIETVPAMAPLIMVEITISIIITLAVTRVVNFIRSGKLLRFMRKELDE